MVPVPQRASPAHLPHPSVVKLPPTGSHMLSPGDPESQPRGESEECEARAATTKGSSSSFFSAPRSCALRSGRGTRWSSRSCFFPRSDWTAACTCFTSAMPPSKTPATTVTTARETTTHCKNGGLRRGMGRGQRGGAPDPDNLISFPSGGEFYKQGDGEDHSVEKMWKPRQQPPRHAVTPSIYIEKLVRAAPVQDPASFNQARALHDKVCEARGK